VQKRATLPNQRSIFQRSRSVFRVLTQKKAIEQATIVVRFKILSEVTSFPVVITFLVGQITPQQQRIIAGQPFISPYDARIYGQGQPFISPYNSRIEMQDTPKNWMQGGNPD
jgi:hypothetical protein